VAVRESLYVARVIDQDSAAVSTSDGIGMVVVPALEFMGTVVGNWVVGCMFTFAFAEQKEIERREKKGQAIATPKKRGKKKKKKKGGWGDQSTSMKPNHQQYRDLFLLLTEEECCSLRLGLLLFPFLLILDVVNFLVVVLMDALNARK
jgi:hypothetical protein